MAKTDNNNGSGKGEDKKGSAPNERDWRETLFLPQTDFPMRAGLPNKEPGHIERWAQMDIYRQLREQGKGRERFVLHDGPPYANGDIHIGHALNKILKDIIIRSKQMTGYDANYVPGWDCHGLPIEWKVEEKYRKKKLDKDDVPINEFRQECRDFAKGWIDVQREQFKRLGIEGDWDNPYLTMNFEAERIIADELMKFAMNGSLYQGSKPVMWSVVERTALAEAEVEYKEKTSPTIWVKFAVQQATDMLKGASVVIWTTTPWTIPANRAIAFSSRINYGLYEVVSVGEESLVKTSETLVLADALAESVQKAAKIEELKRLGDVDPKDIETCNHPFNGKGYDFPVRLYEADYVTDDAGTGFVHIAPGHGADDYIVYVANQRQFSADGILEVPHTVGPDGYYMKDVPLFGGDDPKLVINQKGKFDNANPILIEAMTEAGALLATGKLKHDYPHSWRSKAPVIFRNTPQWFVGVDKDIEVAGKKDSLRNMALAELKEVQFIPETGRNRITSMVEGRPDWVLSRQRAWGVPLTLFVKKGTTDYIPAAGFAGSDKLIANINAAFAEHGSDAWFEDDIKEKVLGGLVDNLDDWEQVTDILDVWFDSGSTHAFVVEQREDLRRPEGKRTANLYLEGSDQHRGWFQSSLLESCGTRGRAPYDTVLTHGFTLDKFGNKMAKSGKNAMPPEKLIKQSGADILRLWVGSVDYQDDQRIGQEAIKTASDSYRKIRNTIRFMLGNLAHYDPAKRVENVADMPELERYMLHRLRDLDKVVRESYEAYDFKKVFSSVLNFCALDLSAFYFDIRKDTLYCEPEDNAERLACLTVIDEIYSCLTAWLAPILPFSMEEVWLSRYGENAEPKSVHLRQFPDVPEDWHDLDLARKWRRVRKVRRVVTGALEVERREKRIGSSLEAAPVVYFEDADDKDLYDAFEGLKAEDIFITSQARLEMGKAPEGVFRLDDVADIAVLPEKAQGQKCARSWKILPDVGNDADYPDLSVRDAAAARAYDKKHSS